jgi:putative ABC transport system substrate-binding protein
MLSRRRFLRDVSTSLLAAPLVAEGQPPSKAPRIMFITTTSPPASRSIEAFLGALRDLGYLEGQNLVIEWRWGHGTTERFGEFAAEAVRLSVDVIVAVNSPEARAAQAATRTIPIVVTTMIDPVESGLVRSFARPGGNLTGLTLRAPELHGKRLQLFKEALPTANSMGVIVEAGARPLADRAETRETEAASRSLGIRLQPAGRDS